MTVIAPSSRASCPSAPGPSAPGPSVLPRHSSIDLVTAAAIVITVLGWASAFPGIRAGLSAFGPFELGSLRFSVAALPCALYLLILRPALPNRSGFVRLILGGLLFISVYTVLLNTGEMTVSSGAASFIINVSPIFVAFLAIYFLKERFGLRAWLGTVISFAGIGLIAVGEGRGFHIDRFHIDRGAVLILAAAVCTAVSTILLKPLYQQHRPLTVMAWTMLFGALFLTPGLPAALAQVEHAEPAALTAAIYLGVVPSVISYGAWSVALSRLPAGRAANLLYCIPPVATLIGWLWLGEVPTTLGMVGGLMALVGVIVVNLRRR